MSEACTVQHQVLAKWAYRQDTGTAAFSNISLDSLLSFTPDPKEQTKPGLRISLLCRHRHGEANESRWAWWIQGVWCCLLGHRSVLRGDQGKASLVPFSLSGLIWEHSNKSRLQQFCLPAMPADSLGKAVPYSKLEAEVIYLYDIVSFIPLVFFLELTFVRSGDKISLGNRFMFSDIISEKSDDKVENLKLKIWW